MYSSVEVEAEINRLAGNSSREKRMEMKTIRVKVYQYNELNDKAKENARYWLLESGIDSQFAWENTQADAENVGIKLHGVHRGTMSGDFVNGSVETAKAIVKEHGKSCETHKTAKAFLDEYSKLEDDSAEMDSLVTEFERSILEDYRIMSENDQEYVASEEAVSETMSANEYTFTKDGKRFG